MPRRCESCTKTALYNVLYETTPKYCEEHSKPGMIYTKSKRCVIDNCLELATCRYIDKKFEYCHLHKPENTYSKEQLGKLHCVFDGCVNRRYYNYQDLPALYCREHALQDMISIGTKRCKSDGCLKIPFYNYPNLKVLYCKQHKKKKMVDVKSDFCQDCEKYASYNFVGNKKAIYCQEHKQKFMVNIKSKSCIHPECTKQPSFNFVGEPFGMYCKTHATDGMMDVVSKKCKFDGCTKQPNFGLPGQLAEYCSDHKSKAMQNVKGKVCEYDNCATLAYFNVVGEKVGKFCELHKNSGMKNVVSKRCLEETCDKISTFGFKGGPEVYCSVHKKDGMTFLRQKLCKQKDCNTIPCYNFIGTKTPIYCYKHKENLMINIVGSYKCDGCNLYFKMVNKNLSLCYYCDENRGKNASLSKEKIIKKLFDDNDLQYELHDKMIPNTNLRYRPDFLFNCNTYFVIIEVDENAHASYAKECEIKRMNDINLELGKPVKFIRFNPDTIVDKQERENILLNTVKNELDNEYCYDLSPIYLFY